LHRAAAEGHYRVATILLNYGASKDPGDSIVFKPLHLAALSNGVNIAELLLEAGADSFTLKI
jgi:ankyrin repeat protein